MEVTVPDGPYSLVINAFQPATELSSIVNPEEYVARSLGATARMLRLVASGECERVIYTSSAVVYGVNPSCREDAPVVVGGLHSSLKLAAEEVVKAYCHEVGLEWTIVRLFNLFGGSDRFSVINRLLRAAESGTEFRMLNNGVSMRDYIHVDDAARCYRAIIDGTRVGVVNVASGRPVTVESMVDVVRASGRPLQVSHSTRAETSNCVANVELLSAYIDPMVFQTVESFLVQSLSRMRCSRL
jgi:UDP-glucose 4-epimerase